MLERLSDRWKREIGGALGRAAIATAAAAAGAVALAFLCAAVFVAVLERYGLVGACLAGAAFFLLVALVLLIVHSVAPARRRRTSERMRAPSESEPPSLISDPRLILAALQVVQAVGLRRLLPLVALGGAAFALASRSPSMRPGARSDARARPRAI